MADWSKAIALEYKVADICARQERGGFNFHKERALQYLEFLDKERESLYQNIRPRLSLEIEDKGPVNKPFKKDGTLSKMSEDWMNLVGKTGDLIGGPFTRINWIEPDLGSRQKLMKQLSRHGWKPLEFTEKGSPSLTEESMESLTGDIGKDISRWYILSHRRSQLQSWVDHVRPDGKITAGIIPMATNTGRAKHIMVVNIPKPNHDKEGNVLWYPVGKVVFGSEMRHVFIPDEGEVLVGADASGLELRMLANRMNDPTFTKTLLEGDIHTEMWEMTKEFVDSRSTQKNITYCLIYGGSDKKIGETAGVVGDRKQTQVGKEIRSRLMGGLPALDRLIKQVQKASERGYLIGLDGRKIWMRRGEDKKVLKHKALNTLLQCDGSLVMKTSLCYFDDFIKKRKIRTRQCAFIHDEVQLTTHVDDVSLAGDTFVESIQLSGKFFKMTCPLDGEWKSGESYAYTH